MSERRSIESAMTIELELVPPPDRVPVDEIGETPVVGEPIADDEVFAPLIAELNEVLPLESAIIGRSDVAELIGNFIREFRKNHPDRYEAVLAPRKSHEAL